MPDFDQVIANFRGAAQPAWSAWHAEEQSRDLATQDFFAPIAEFIAALNEKVSEFSRGTVSVQAEAPVRDAGSLNATVKIIFHTSDGVKEASIGRDGDSFVYSGSRWSTQDSGMYTSIVSDFRSVLFPPAPTLSRRFPYQRVT